MFSIWETIFETWEWKEELIEGFAKEMFGVKYKEKEAGLQKKKKTEQWRFWSTKEKEQGEYKQNHRWPTL